VAKTPQVGGSVKIKPAAGTLDLRAAASAELGRRESLKTDLTEAPCPPGPLKHSQVLKLRKKAIGGDKKALAKLREHDLLPTEPAFAGYVLKRYADMLSGTRNEYVRAVTLNGYETMRMQLEGPNPTAIERLLVERIVVCHAAVYTAERAEAIFSDGVQKQIDRLHHRYLSAFKALAQFRRIDLPAIQVNIAEKQINIG